MRTHVTPATWTTDAAEDDREREVPWREFRRKRGAGTGRCTVTLLLAGTIAALAGCARGEYRMPYANGTIVEVENDHVTHSSPKAYMYDIKAQSPTPAAVVAAAPGWVRFIDDSHEEPTATNNYVWIEHPAPFCPVDPSRATWPGRPANYDASCVPCEKDFCNEWTTYAHMTRNSVRGDAGLSEGDWVEAGTFLGYEDEVGTSSIGEHLHWHVAVIPPDTVPTYNGYYLDYVNDTGQQPEVIPIVCHQDGRSVLWRTGTYTAGGCPDKAPPARSVILSGSVTQSAVQDALRQIATIADEAVWIALASPKLMRESRRLLTRLEPDFQDLLHLGRARVSRTELNSVLAVMVEYERRGSADLRRVLEPIRQQLKSPAGRSTLGIVVDDRFAGLD